MDVRAEQKAELARRKKKGVASELSESNKAEMQKALQKKSEIRAPVAPEKRTTLQRLAAAVDSLSPVAAIKGRMKKENDEVTEKFNRKADKY